MDKRKMKKLLILNLPYFLVGLFATNLGEAWRLAEGADSSAKILSFFHALPIALNNPFPSFHPLDLLIGILCGAGLRLAVYLKGKNAKKYRHNVEYGSARWGTAKDIEPFIAPKFEDNVILTKTERLMMSNRPKNPANARNKNVLIIGGSGSGKTRFWLKPNLLQMHSSYVVTDPKGSIVIECGNALLKHGYDDPLRKPHFLRFYRIELLATAFLLLRQNQKLKEGWRLSAKLDRIGADLEKARKKRAEWDAKVKDLERRYREEENSEIHEMVHAANLNPEQLSELLRMFAADMAPKPDTINTMNEEETQNEI